jgi:cytochrome c
MSDLSLNKWLAAACAVGLGVLGLNTLSGAVFSGGGGHGAHDSYGDAHAEGEAPPKFAYMPDMPEAVSAEVAVDTGPLDFGTLLRAANIDAGARIARQCVSCHTLEAGGADGTGPHMWGVMGRTAGTVAGYRYSDGMKAYGKPWSYQNMYEYLESPRAYVPGTSMGFAGIRKSEDRINIVAYLISLSDSPIALPDPLPAVMVEAPADPAAEGVVTDAAVEVPAEGATPDAAAPAPAAPATPAAQPA